MLTLLALGLILLALSRSTPLKRNKRDETKEKKE